MRTWIVLLLGAMVLKLPVGLAGCTKPPETPVDPIKEQKGKEAVEKQEAKAEAAQ
ncbi:MAG: hypothetical protein K6T17_01465 [Fimbriimonadales bacterium]|nr:hypothetical protein [Fimbriimonadales bacterium]